MQCSDYYIFLFENGKIKIYNFDMNQITFPSQLYIHDHVEIPIIGISYRRLPDNHNVFGVIFENGIARWWEANDQNFREINIPNKQVTMLSFLKRDEVFYLLDDGTLHKDKIGDETKHFRIGDVVGIQCFDENYIIHFKNGTIASNSFQIEPEFYFDLKNEPIDVDYFSCNGEILVVLFKNGHIKCFRIVGNRLNELILPEDIILYHNSEIILK